MYFRWFLRFFVLFGPYDCMLVAIVLGLSGFLIIG